MNKQIYDDDFVSFQVVIICNTLILIYKQHQKSSTNFIIYYVMKYRKNCLDIMLTFHSRENIKTCIFTAVKMQDLIFSWERNRKIGTIFSIFSIWSKGSNSLWHICFFSKGNNYW